VGNLSFICACAGEAGGGGGEGVEGEEQLAPQRKKTTSFKITNVFLSRPPSNDGDESNEDCEDLEDSHTEVSPNSRVVDPDPEPH
jgi:hypothetical protein